jgi:hypothetical protein
MDFYSIPKFGFGGYAQFSNYLYVHGPLVDRIECNKSYSTGSLAKDTISLPEFKAVLDGHGVLSLP